MRINISFYPIDIMMQQGEMKSRDILERTEKSFGYQWREFKEISSEDEKHFLTYIFPVEPSFF